MRPRSRPDVAVDAAVVGVPGVLTMAGAVVGRSREEKEGRIRWRWWARG